jgi:hypothetical protein
MQAAAKALGVNQSTVQRRLAELEGGSANGWWSGTLAAIGSPSLVGNYGPPPKRWRLSSAALPRATRASPVPFA